MCSSRPILLLLTMLTCAALAGAQELEISASPTPVGSGARAASMADAFVAIADDATAASWNPAGLVQLERPELSLVGSWNAIYESFEADWHPETDSSHFTDNFDLNYFSFAYPLPMLVLGRNATVSINYQRKYDFTRDSVLDYNKAYYDRGLITNFATLDFQQEGGLAALSPAFAIEVTNRLSVGVTVNFWRDSFFSNNGWEQRTVQSTLSSSNPSFFYFVTDVKEKYEDFRGENATLGLLWTPNDRWSFGLRYDTAFTGDVEYESLTTWTSLAVPGLQPTLYNIISRSKHEDRKVRFPDSLAVGVARRFSDRFTLSMDVTRTDWNDFYVENGEGARSSLVDASSLDNPLTRPDFDPTYTVRLGGEYVFLPYPPPENLNTLWTLRGGLFLDQEPATGRPTGWYWPWQYQGDGDPDNFYGFAAGAGVQLNQRVNIDFAYQLRYGPGVNSDFIRNIRGFEEDVVQHRALLSVVWYF